VNSEVSIVATKGRSKRKRKNRVSVTDGWNGVGLREVSRILLIITTKEH
jgi:hypothetical protein